SGPGAPRSCGTSCSCPRRSDPATPRPRRGARAATRPAPRATCRSSARAPRPPCRRWPRASRRAHRAAARSLLLLLRRRECPGARLDGGTDLVLELEVFEVGIALEAHALEHRALFLHAHELVRRDLPMAVQEVHLLGAHAPALGCQQ